MGSWSEEKKFAASNWHPFYDHFCFVISINDIFAGVSSTLRLFADDCVLYRTVANPGDRDAL